jgi:hypothetical protein
MDPADLVLVPWNEAHAALAGRRIAFRVLAPPYPAVGGGTLRVLRVRASGEAPLDVICGYERYRRL